MILTAPDIKAHEATHAIHQMLSGFYTIGIYLVSEKSRYDKTLRFAAEKICLTPVRKDTNLDGPSRKTIRTNPSTVSEGRSMVQPFWLSEDYPDTGVNICLAVPRNGPQKIKQRPIAVRLCELRNYCLFWGMYVLTNFLTKLSDLRPAHDSCARHSVYKILFGGKINRDTAAIGDDSTPYPHGNFNSIGVS